MKIPSGFNLEWTEYFHNFLGHYKIPLYKKLNSVTTVVLQSPNDNTYYCPSILILTTPFQRDSYSLKPVCEEGKRFEQEGWTLSR